MTTTTVATTASEPGTGARVATPRRRGARAAAAVAALVGAALLVAVPGAAPAAAVESYPVPPGGSWQVRGHGWGHAIGLGQWSAQGAARAGRSAESIVDAAYPGTTGAHVGNPLLRVRLTSAAAAAVTVRAPAGAQLWVADAATRASAPVPAGEYTVATGGATTVTRAGGGPVAVGGRSSFSGDVEVASADGVQLRTADGSWLWYRGMIRLAPASGVLTVTNHVDLRQYLYGVVPRESPSWFHREALRAQAYVARSYALAVARPQGGFDICDTTACQVYGGRARVSASGAVTSLEHASTTAAVDSTDGWILTHGGQPAFTQFSASTGGWTRAGSRPYLVAQADPWSGTEPKDGVHAWTDTLSVATVERSCPAGGRLESLDVVARDGRGEWGGRVTEARVRCTTGAVRVTGESALRFGMRSSWWSLGPAGSSPRGHLDQVETAPGRVTVRGWAADPDEPGRAIGVHVYVGATAAATTVAGLPRPDVAAVFPALGAAHGYEVTAVVPPGAHRVCAWGIDTAGHGNTTLGCREVGVPAGAGVLGHLDTATAGGPGRLRVTGWAAQPGSGALPVRVSVGGVAAERRAGVPRPDVGRAYPLLGASVGVDETLLVPAGSHRVCLAAGPEPTSLGCADATVPAGAPAGWLDAAHAVPGGVAGRGWAFDPSGAAATVTLAAAPGTPGPAVAATGPSPNLAAVHPWAGGTRGFTATAAAPPGTRRVCARAGAAGGAASDLNCLEVHVPGPAPFGWLDAVEVGATGARVAGWAADPLSGDPVRVSVTVGPAGTAGAGAAVPVAGGGTADRPRPDVHRAHPGWDERRGFDLTVPVPAGAARPLEVCLRVHGSAAAAAGDASGTVLGCRRV